MLTNRTISNSYASSVSRDRSKEYGGELRSQDLMPVGLEPHAPKVLLGSVIEVNQQLNCYKVRFEDHPDVLAFPMESAGSGYVNKNATSSLFGVGTTVLVLLSKYLGTNAGVILGSTPEHLGQITLMGSGEFIPASPVGSFIDKISMECLNSEKNNFNNGRPVDAYPGDIAVLSSFGSGLFVSALQASLRSSSECAVECHYVDSLLRMTGYNFEQFSAGSDTQFVADFGDYTEIKRGNPYVIESVGGTEQYGEFPKENGKPRSSLTSPDPKMGKYTVQKEDQVGWWRWLDLSGYLANIKLNFVLVPKLEDVRQGAKNNEEQDEHAVFREHVDSSGAYSIVSAKSISLIKDCLIPAPREQYRADDSRGDIQETVEQARQANEQNLMDASIDGVESKLPHASVLYPMASSDMAAFKTHRSLVMFRERKNDWSLKEVDEIDLAGFRSVVDGQGLISPSTNVSGSRMYAELPKVGKLKINAREEVRYFASRSMIMMHDDGSIHIQDGYGSSISMRGGCIDISCPGDITLRPGRNLVGFAGDSISAVAGVDVELCGMKGDVRIQGDRNISMLSGNDGSGGILLETKAQFSPLTAPDQNTFKAPETNANPYRGIWLKASGAAVCSLAKQAYVGNSKDPCKIVMDCGQSEFSVYGSLAYFLAETTNFITEPTNPKSGTVLTVSKTSGMRMTTPGSFYFQGKSFWAGSGSTSSAQGGDMNFYVNGNLALLGTARLGGLSVKQSGGGGGMVPKIEDDPFATFVSNPITEVLTKISTGTSEILDVYGARLKAVESSMVRSKNSSLKNLVFYYPDSDLRGVPESAEYVLFESDWQQAYRTQGQGAQMSIRGVKKEGPGSDGVSLSQSYCWPGAKALQSKFGKLNSGYRFVTDGLGFKSSGFDQPLQLLDSPGSFENNYTIIRSNKIRTT